LAKQVAPFLHGSGEQGSKSFLIVAIFANYFSSSCLLTNSFTAIIVGEAGGTLTLVLPPDCIPLAFAIILARILHLTNIPAPLLLRLTGSCENGRGRPLLGLAQGGGCASANANPAAAACAVHWNLGRWLTSGKFDR
jgi:hypothetical protein